MTQSERAESAVADLLELFPKLSQLKATLSRVLEDAQNPTPLGASDGTIDETRYAQLRSIERALSKVLIAQLFGHPPVPKPIQATPDAEVPDDVLWLLEV